MTEQDIKNIESILSKGDRAEVIPTKDGIKEVICMDYNAEYIELLKRSLAGETETVRLYLAVMALAPDSAIPKLLEVQADETDHIAILSDLLAEAMSGQSADQEKLVPGVE